MSTTTRLRPAPTEQAPHVRADLAQVRRATTAAEGDQARIVLARQAAWLSRLGIAVTDVVADAASEYEDPWGYYRDGGALILATLGAEPVGVVTLRPLPTDERGSATLELRRLFVVPEARGLGIGPRLLDTAVSTAREMFAARIVLETIPGPTDAAIALYRASGFVDTAPFDVDLPGIVALERRL